MLQLELDALHQGNVNTNSIAIGTDALFNVDSDFIDPETNDYMIYTDNPSTTLDESIYGMPGNIAIRYWLICITCQFLNLERHHLVEVIFL